MSEYTLKYKISNDELLELIKLDAKCYNEEYNRGTFDKCLSWYNKNDEIYICLLHNDKIVGYINFCPLTDQAYQEYRNLNLHDYDLTQNHIPKYQDNTDVKCLFMSIVISEEHRDGEAIKCLLEGLENKLIDLKNRGMLNYGQSLLLQREYNNKYDSNAVQVLHSQSRQVLGYIPKDTVSRIAEKMDKGTSFIAYVETVTGRNGYNLGININAIPIIIEVVLIHFLI